MRDRTRTSATVSARYHLVFSVLCIRILQSYSYLHSLISVRVRRPFDPTYAYSLMGMQVTYSIRTIQKMRTGNMKTRPWMIGRFSKPMDFFDTETAELSQSGVPHPQAVSI